MLLCYNNNKNFLIKVNDFFIILVFQHLGEDENVLCRTSIYKYKSLVAIWLSMQLSQLVI